MHSRYLLMFTAAGVIACGRVPSSDLANATPTLVLDTTRGADNSSVTVAGLSSSQLDALRRAQLSPEQWRTILPVSVADGDSVPIVGKYSIEPTVVRFVPMFPFDPGRRYRARFNAEQVSSLAGVPSLTTDFGIPRGDARPSARIVRVVPSGEIVPANLLRIYVEFSAPMSRNDGLPHVKLLDAKEQEVRDAFLPLEADFWSGDAMRYTFFLDPGRVKRGILSNEQMGRALEEGARYTLALDSTWRDERGEVLVSGFRHSFSAGAPVDARINLSEWKVDAPKAGTRNAVVVRTLRPLDYGLMQRALGVEDPRGRPIEGDVTIPPGEREWRFTPRENWRAGEYKILVLGFLEDVSGNRIDRPFEVDMFERTDRDTAPERYYIPLPVR